MTAAISASSSPSNSPSPAILSSGPNPNHPALPPLITSPPTRRSALPRPMSHTSKNRLSQYSTGSNPSRSRPPSHVFPFPQSSLPYSLVRDFAYPASHPMHCGPPPEPSRPPSGMTTPASEQRRLSDPSTAWESRASWSVGSTLRWTGDGFARVIDVPPMQFADGPPWSEDEDLHSPVVSSRHRKHKSSGLYGHGRSRSARDARDAQGSAQFLNPDHFDGQRGYYVGTGGDGSERFYVSEGGEANGPGGEFVMYPPPTAMYRDSNPYQLSGHQAEPLIDQGDEYRSDSEKSSRLSSPGYQEQDQSRYSRDYQFTITSPDEEMHGKAVALFDFERENENELPLVEGQIIWVSYRHGQGWLVAEDPKTQESGLVPEEYVRLLRDIEGGMSSLTGNLGEGAASPNDDGTPTQADAGHFGHSPTPSSSTNGYHQPVVSTFSTSSKDLDPYPQHLLGTQAGQAPPQVIHYHGQRGGSQANTPTLQSSQDMGTLRRDSQEAALNKSGGTPATGTLTNARMEAAGAEGVGVIVDAEH